MEEIVRLQNYEPFWGEWRVTSLLHEGSISNIYHVENGSSKGIVKVIPIPKLQNDFRNSSRSLEDTEAMHGFCKEVVEVLQEELERIRCLDSIPNILGYRKYEVFERKEGVGYDIVLLMDEEQNLSDYVAERDVQNEEIVKIVKDVAWILDKAHQEGILHKNIKLENIFITETGESMLADFSLTRKIESFQSRNQRKGNNVYTAPEVLSEYDFSELTDVYALGVVLYLLLNDCKMPPVFENRDARTEIPKPGRAGEKLSEVAMKAIAYRAKERYQSAEEFFKALYSLKEKDFVLPPTYVKSERRKQEQREIAELERKKQEELAKEEEERKRQEELAKEEEERRRQEELAKEEEERRRQEELAKEEEERRRQEELAKEEEERRRQEELAKEEEERRRQEELAKEEEERKRQEELAKEEEERRRQEELAKEEERRRQQELLRIEAEEERRRIAEEKMVRERQKDESLPVSSEALFFEEETLGGAASQLHSSMKQMEQMTSFSNYSMPEEKEELIDEIIASVSTEQKKRQLQGDGQIDNKTLLETLAAQKDGEPDVKLHSDETEYGGFFDFSKEAYQEQDRKQEALYDKNMDEEPFEQKMANFPKETRSKKPFFILIIMVLIIAGGIYLFQNPQIRKSIQDTYDSAIAYFSVQALD